MRLGIIERAHELAASGCVSEMRELRKQLVAEGYEDVEQFISGAYLLRQLISLMAASGKAAPLAKAIESKPKC